MKKKIIILSARIGSGHHAAANAIKEAFQSYEEVYEVVIADYYQIIQPALAHIKYAGYLSLVSRFPTLFKNRSYNLNHKRRRMLSHRQLSLMDSFLKAENPVVVISVFPAASACISILKEKNRTDVKLFTLITDIYASELWLHPETDIYFTASAYLKTQFLDKGIDDEKSLITGYPVKSAYLTQQDALKVKLSLGYTEDDFLILMTGGGLGFLPDSACFYYWLDHLRGTKTILLSSSNKRLYKRVKGLKLSNIRLLDFVDNMPDLMKAADLVVGKAGGITLYEMIASHVPFIVFKPMLKQEMANCQFIRDKEIGMIINDVNSLKEELLKLSKNRAGLELFRQNILALREEMNLELIVKTTREFE